MVLLLPLSLLLLAPVSNSPCYPFSCLSLAGGGHLSGSPLLLASHLLSHTPRGKEGNHGAGGNDGGPEEMDPVDDDVDDNRSGSLQPSLAARPLYYGAETLPLPGTLVSI